MEVCVDSKSCLVHAVVIGAVLACRVADEQPVSERGVVGRKTVTLVVVRSPGVASCQLHARHHDEHVSTRLGADRPRAVDVRRILGRPVRTSNEPATHDFALERPSVDPTTRTRPTFTHRHTATH